MCVFEAQTRRRESRTQRQRMPHTVCVICGARSWLSVTTRFHGYDYRPSVTADPMTTANTHSVMDTSAVLGWPLKASQSTHQLLKGVAIVEVATTAIQE